MLVLCQSKVQGKMSAYHTRQGVIMHDKYNNHVPTLQEGQKVPTNIWSQLICSVRTETTWKSNYRSNTVFKN